MTYIIPAGTVCQARRQGKPWSDYTTTRDLEFAYSVADLSPHYRVFERDGAYLKVSCKDFVAPRTALTDQQTVDRPPQSCPTPVADAT